jgi:hypothetical protein
VSSTDDILAMLDQVASKQFRCAVCGRNDDLYHVTVEMQTRTAGARFDGKIGIDYDLDSDYIAAPVAVLPTQNWVICGNFDDHHTDGIQVPDGVVVDRRPDSSVVWVWHPLPAASFEYMPWPEIQTLRGLDPDN